MPPSSPLPPTLSTFLSPSLCHSTFLYPSLSLPSTFLSPLSISLPSFYISLSLSISLPSLSLPEVPVLVDVPCLSAQLDDSLLQTVRERVGRHGSVASHPPVQIEELVERPGSMLVRWCKVSLPTAPTATLSPRQPCAHGNPVPEATLCTWQHSAHSNVYPQQPLPTATLWKSR